MNPYLIYHSVLLSASGSIISTHWALSEAEARNKAYNKARKGQKVFTLTDKQWCMAVNSWDGAPKLPKWGRPLVVRGSGCFVTFPLTKKQYHNIHTK